MALRAKGAYAEFTGAAAPQAFLRAGCVHLTFDSLHQQRPELRWGQVAEALGPEVLANRTVLLQRGQSAALLVNGQQTASWDAEQAGGPAKLTARLQHVAPCCAVAGQPLQLLLSGFGLDAADIKLHARHQGRFLGIQAGAEASGAAGEPPAAPAADASAGVAEQGSVAAGERGASSRRVCLAAELDPVPSPGLVWIEVEQQHLISRPQPLLVLPDAEMASELLLLEWALGPERTSKVGLGCRGAAPGAGRLRASRRSHPACFRPAVAASAQPPTEHPPRLEDARPVIHTPSSSSLPPAGLPGPWRAAGSPLHLPAAPDAQVRPGALLSRRLHERAPALPLPAAAAVHQEAKPAPPHARLATPPPANQPIPVSTLHAASPRPAHPAAQAAPRRGPAGRFCHLVQLRRGL